MKKYLCLTLLAALLLSGCGTMTVEVDIFDRAKNETPFILPKISKQESRIKVATLNNRYEDDQNRLLQAINDATDNTNIIPGTDLFTFNNDLRESATAEIIRTYQDAQSNYALGLGAMQSYRDIDEKKPPEKYQQLLIARAAFDKGDSDLLALRTKVISFATQIQTLEAFTPTSQPASTIPSSSQASTTAASSKSATAKINNINDATAAASDDIIAGQGLLDDPMASAVIGADDKFWIRNYNRTFGLGLIGDTDLAIQMNSIGDFTIKGARIDASKATAATFDGIRLIVSVAAAAYGVPIPLGKPPAPSTPDATAAASSTDTSTTKTQLPADAVSQAKQDISAAANSKMLATQAEINILDAIIAQRAVVSDLKDPDALKASIQIIQNTYSANRPNLVQSSTTSTGG